VINASEAIGSEHGTIHLGTRPITADREYLDQTVGDKDLPPGDYVVLQITDTGAGMDAETKALIFDPFFTTKFTGRGLGLAAVQGIIRAHKGAIKVYSERGKGTTFKILLPAVRGEASPPTDAPESVMKATGSGTILVIDDDTGVRKTAAKILERAGYSAIEATNGAQGVELFRADKDFIRAVLLDLTMPGMDGEETFRQLRQIRPDVRVILMSGFNEQEAVQRFVGRGLAGFAQKPFSSDILLRRVQSILDSEPPAGI
jgi:CheY-like chemotaxis protein